MCKCGVYVHMPLCGKKPGEYIIHKSPFYYVQTWFLTALRVRWEAANPSNTHLPLFYFSKCWDYRNL